jgi:hypothetical protein
MARIAQLRDVDLTALSDPDLDEHVGRVADLFQESHRIHFLLQGAIVLALGDLAAACRELCRDEADPLRARLSRGAAGRGSRGR